MSFLTCWDAFYRDEKPSETKVRAHRIYEGAVARGVDLSGLEEFIRTRPRASGQDFNGLVKAYINRDSEDQRNPPPVNVVTVRPPTLTKNQATHVEIKPMPGLAEAIDGFWDRWPGPEGDYKGSDKRAAGEFEFSKLWLASDIPAFVNVTLARLSQFETDTNPQRRMFLGNFRTWCATRWRNEKLAPAPVSTPDVAIKTWGWLPEVKFCECPCGCKASTIDECDWELSWSHPEQKYVCFGDQNPRPTIVICPECNSSYPSYQNRKHADLNKAMSK